MRLLVMDTCGEVASFALAEQGSVLLEGTLPPRTSSAELIPALRAGLATLGWNLSQLAGIGVVAGPGSFTGVRVGLAAAKALCEVGGVPLATVSRLAVMARKAPAGATVVLDAGRREIFVRAADGRDHVLGLEAMAARAVSGAVWIAEPALLEPLAALRPELTSLKAADAVPLVQVSIAAGGTDVALADAEYARGEQDMYRTGVNGGSGQGIS